MSIFSKFTVTPLLYACGALLALSIGLGIALKLKSGDVTTAEAATQTALAQRDTAITEREAWKLDATAKTAAAKASEASVTSLIAALREQQQETLRIQDAGHKAVAAARTAAIDADRALKTFTSKFQVESRKPTCARALAAMEQACPALRDY